MIEKEGGDMMNGYGTGMGAGGWTLMIVFWLLLVAVIGLAITRIFPSVRGDGSADVGSRSQNPERLLDERLARGEIDVETYEQLHEALAGRGDRK
jgi:putative membrane protein